jgi:hypothetical protein
MGGKAALEDMGAMLPALWEANPASTSAADTVAVAVVAAPEGIRTLRVAHRFPELAAEVETVVGAAQQWRPMDMTHQDTPSEVTAVAVEPQARTGMVEERARPAAMEAVGEILGKSANQAQSRRLLAAAPRAELGVRTAVPGAMARITEWRRERDDSMSGGRVAGRQT